MKKYTFHITETLTRAIEVNAHNGNKAYEKISSMYADEEIILSADDFSYSSIHKNSPHDKNLLINEIVDYLYADEQRHYEENPERNHIFLKLKQLREMLD